MENIPLPSDAAYEIGDRVRLYVSDDDPDAQFHGEICEVIEDQPDDLGAETGREIDSHHYRLRRVSTDQELQVTFRHIDLVPVSEWPVEDDDLSEYPAAIHRRHRIF